MLLLTVVCGVTRADEPVYDIDIPSMNAAQALNRFAEQTGAITLFPYDLASTRQANAVRGRYTLLEGLDLLLRGTGLSGGLSDKRVVSISQTENQQRHGEEGAMPEQNVSLRRKIAAFVASIFSASVASGQDTDVKAEALEEIIVTAQKREERLQDVPMAVTAIDGDTLVTNNLLRLEDYYRKLPGVSLTLAGNGSEPQIIIRGMSTTLTGNPTAGVVIDEIPYGRSRSLAFNVSMPDVDPFDLARVEVLRGPQGTLYGASSIGGLLKFVTMDPSTESLSGRVQIGSTYVNQGDDIGHSVRGVTNIPLSDTLAVRVSGFTLRDPGYIDNAQTGERDINRRESDGGRLAALWQPGENFSAKLTALIQESHRDGMADSDVTREPNLERLELPGVGGYERKSEFYSATLTGKLGAVDLVSATGYSTDNIDNSVETLSAATRAQATQFFPGTGRASTGTRMEDEKFTQELRASLPIGQRLNWLFGLFYTEEKDQYRVDVLANAPTGAVAGLLRMNSALPTTRFEERAVFTNLTIDITDRFDVQFGGRFSENEQVFARASLTPTGAYPVGTGPNFFETTRSEDDAFTYLVTPRFKVSPDLMAYARVATGYRPGGPNFNCGILPPELCAFDSDTSTNYEIGLKAAMLDRKLSFDTSVYHIDWKDIQVGPLFLPGTTTTYLTNGSRATSSGVELSAEAKPFSGLSLATWVVYNDAKLAEPMSTLSGVVAKGTRLPFSSRWSGGLSAEQTFPLWSGAEILLGADASYIDERPGTLSNTNMLRAKPSYVQIDVRAGLTYDSWTVSAFVNNVADKRGMLRGGDDALGPNLANYIQPRTVGLSVTKDFGR